MVASYFYRSKELFIIPYYMNKSGADSFFPSTLHYIPSIYLITSHYRTIGLFFHLRIPDSFKYNAMLFLRHSDE